MSREGKELRHPYSSSSKKSKKMMSVILLFGLINFCKIDHSHNVLKKDELNFGCKKGNERGFDMF